MPGRRERSVTRIAAGLSDCLSEIFIFIGRRHFLKMHFDDQRVLVAEVLYQHDIDG